MTRVEERYGKKVLYENGEWLITSQDKKDQYQRMANQYLPKDGQILKMYKSVYCMER